MSYRILVIAFVLICIISCKPDRSGRLIPELDQRMHDDSVKYKAEQDMKIKLETKFSLLDSISSIEKEISSIGLKLDALETELVLKKNKLAGIKEFKLFRSENKREQQVAEQLRIISILEDKLIKFRDVKMNLQIRLDDYEGEIRRIKEQ